MVLYGLNHLQQVFKVFRVYKDYRVFKVFRVYKDYRV